jgi:hypothetical protein
MAGRRPGAGRARPDRRLRRPPSRHRTPWLATGATGASSGIACASPRLGCQEREKSFSTEVERGFARIAGGVGHRSGNRCEFDYLNIFDRSGTKFA